MSTISRFEIKKLHGYKNIDLHIKDNTLILVGENGAGKTTVLHLFYYLLSGQWISMAQYLHDQCNVVHNPATSVNQAQVEFGKSVNYKKLTRGKYVFWFLIEFCNTVHRDAVALFTGLTKPPKINVTLSSSNGMAVIGARARFPASLKDFLKATFCDYIETKSATAG